MALSELEFLVLNTLADGPEPFSRVYVEVVQDQRDGAPAIADLADALCALVDAGLARPEGRGPCKAATLVQHYARLDEELLDFLGDPDADPESGEGPDDTADVEAFRYSRPEWVFAMTEPGRTEWDRPEYARFYPDEPEDDGDGDAPPSP